MIDQGHLKYLTVEELRSIRERISPRCWKALDSIVDPDQTFNTTLKPKEIFSGKYPLMICVSCKGIYKTEPEKATASVCFGEDDPLKARPQCYSCRYEEAGDKVGRAIAEKALREEGRVIDPTTTHRFKEA